MNGCSVVALTVGGLTFLVLLVCAYVISRRLGVLLKEFERQSCQPPSDTISRALRLEVCKIEKTALDREEALLRRSLRFYKDIEEGCSEAEKFGLRRAAEGAFLPELTPHEKLLPSEIIEQTLAFLPAFRARYHSCPTVRVAGENPEGEGAGVNSPRGRSDRCQSTCAHRSC